ncbi:chorismate mutase [Rhodococcus coprophilus]|uniref:Probable chorismate mutase n=1 Tax=Rhodococcus coprophilus TaxID=38310 RepID=A0A2X4TQF0_9NOCA|nr:chorismate mutase [Rhodococcus coprophilus]MBM7457466.1 chorismate mutase [Rhodococcus coprophilus]SQI29767.1 probable chorismate mutase [Rhodococcus coprophilus]
MTVQLDSPGIDTQGTASAAEAELGTLFAQVQELDAQILDVIKRRAELAQRIGAVAKESGASREAQAEEMAVLDRFGELGADGNTLAMTLLRLGRTRRG